MIAKNIRYDRIMPHLCFSLMSSNGQLNVFKKKKHEQDNANLSKVFYIKIIPKLLINYFILLLKIIKLNNKYLLLLLKTLYFILILIFNI